MDYNLKDSGEREEFVTGSRRDTQKGKTRPDLIPHELTRRLGDLLGKGAEKYGERNWESGQPLSRVMASLKRHLLQIEEGDTSEDHMAAVVFGIMVFMHHLPRIADGRLPAALADTEWSDAWLATFAPPDLFDPEDDTKKPGFYDWLEEQIFPIPELDLIAHPLYKAAESINNALAGFKADRLMVDWGTLFPSFDEIWSEANHARQIRTKDVGIRRDIAPGKVLVEVAPQEFFEIEDPGEPVWQHAFTNCGCDFCKGVIQQLRTLHNIELLTE